jgi:hypothetical protein
LRSRSCLHFQGGFHGPLKGPRGSQTGSAEGAVNMSAVITSHSCEALVSLVQVCGHDMTIRLKHPDWRELLSKELELCSNNTIQLCGDKDLNLRKESARLLSQLSQLSFEELEDFTITSIGGGDSAGEAPLKPPPPRPAPPRPGPFAAATTTEAAATGAPPPARPAPPPSRPAPPPTRPGI